MSLLEPFSSDGVSSNQSLHNARDDCLDLLELGEAGNCAQTPSSSSSQVLAERIGHPENPILNHLLNQLVLQHEASTGTSDICATTVHSGRILGDKVSNDILLEIDVAKSDLRIHTSSLAPLGSGWGIFW